MTLPDKQNRRVATMLTSPSQGHPAFLAAIVCAALMLSLIPTTGSAQAVAVAGASPEAPTADLAATAIQVSAGTSHTCAVLADRTVRCWGEAEFGKLGYANTRDIGDDESPGSAGAVDLGANRTAAQISAGAKHTCAVLDNGTVRCWVDATEGKLGSGNTNTIADQALSGSVNVVDLGAGRTAVQISAGTSHTCAVLDNGTVRCWGSGLFGQLGYGNTNTIGDDETPGSAGPVNLGSGRTAVQVSAGTRHTCAVLDNGSVRCWGRGQSGQLGYGNTNDVGDNETAGSVGPVNLGSGRTATQVSAGEDHTCAVLDDRTVRCWGDGDRGRLGYGNTSDIGDTEAPGAVGPVDLGSGRLGSQVGAGELHTCSVLTTGAVRCWGDARDGRLGYAVFENIGDDETPGSVGPVYVGTGRTAVQVSVGAKHSCAVLDDGGVRCWGDGEFGKLGYGNTESIGDDEAPGSVGPVDLGQSTPVLTDVPAWVADAVQWLVGNGYAGGYPDNTFRPDLPITRAQVANMLHGIAGKPSPGAGCGGLSDVPGWARDGICWLVNEGHAGGYPDDTFRPDLAITRAQVANMLHGIAGKPSPGAGCGGLSDVPGWARDGICWLVNEGHAGGYPDNTFRPDWNITRAQVANMLYRIHG